MSHKAVQNDMEGHRGVWSSTEVNRGAQRVCRTVHGVGCL